MTVLILGYFALCPAGTVVLQYKIAITAPALLYSKQTQNSVTLSDMAVRNVNKEHKESLSTQEKIALVITKGVGSMWCAYIFAGIALISLPAAIRGGTATIISWIAQTFLQLVLLSIIMVGQNVASKHAERRADADFEVNVKAEKEINEIKQDLEEIKALLLER